MKDFKGKIIDPVGLHARPASIIVSVASKFNSKITIISGDKKGNLKSIMNIMSLGIKKDENIVVEADGEDENEAIAEIEKVMKENELI